MRSALVFCYYYAIKLDHSDVLRRSSIILSAAGFVGYDPGPGHVAPSCNCITPGVDTSKRTIRALLLYERQPKMQEELH